MKHLQHIPSLIQAAKQGDLRTLDIVSRMIAATLVKKHPNVAKSINNIIDSEMDYFRDNIPIPTPVDSDSQMELVRVQNFSESPPRPLLNIQNENDLERFIEERLIAEKLAEIDEAPPSTLIFTGLPGVGKTMSAKWLAYRLDLALVEVDLATVVSSYLGKTGQNLRGILDYARTRPCVLFLDEFDALAKTRDDSSDLGELKRIVNVLLKEIELWPSRGVLVAATNHPGIIDPAIWRRFDVKIEFSMPEPEARKAIISGAFKPLEIREELLSFSSELLENYSGSDLVQLVSSAKRYSILHEENIEKVLLQFLAKPIRFKWDRVSAKRFVELHKSAFKKKISNVFYSKLFDKTEGTIRNLLKRKEKEDGKK